MTKKRYIFLLLATVCCFGCSTKKNTWATRTFHTTTTRYNIHFNATNSFNEGIRNMEKAHKDDFSQLLPLFPISVHENGQAIAANMDVTIEKCRKSIKQHSIKAKPKRNPKKLKDPKYQNFLKQEEFNPMIKKAWILLGQAEFHKSSFMESVSTFFYIIRHFSTEPEVVTESRIWIARGYAEMGWLFEAEESLEKINENDVTQRLTPLFAATKADLLLKRNRGKEAIPFLEVAADKEKNKYQRMRFNYVLGQLYLLENSPQKALERFNLVVKSNPAYLFNFNAQLNALQIETKHPDKAIKELTKMAKNDNNADYLDQIYLAIANIYIKNGDEKKAIENYKLSIEKSTRNGVEKALTLTTLGDLYYKNKEYVEAHPCFEEAAQLMKTDNSDYPRVSKLAEVLGEIATNYAQVQLQDSLQNLAKLSEKEQREVIDKIIKQIIKEEEEAKAKAAEDAIQAQGDLGFNRFGNNSMANDLIGAGSTEWYFYNPQLMNKGRAEFQRRWGRRKLEDNWRRMNKSAQILTNEETAADTEQLPDSIKQLKKDSLPEDNKNPEFYLAQIPKTEAQFQKSNELIADGLFALGEIYKNKLEDFDSAIEMFLTFQRRFPKDERKVDSYYNLYQIYQKKEQSQEADAARNVIVRDFPESKYAIILSQPDYLERMEKMYKIQDDLYKATYTAYTNNNFQEVFKNYRYISEEYPLSPLLPKFTFLNALSIGKTEPADTFFNALTELIKKFPNSDVTPMSKDILALMSQGEEAQQGGTHGSLMERREENLAAIEKEETGKTQELTPEKNTPFTLILVQNTADKKTTNKLLFDLAAFNFSKFLIKDFDLAVRKIDGKECLVISNFENYEEVLWYEKLLMEEPSLTERIAEANCRHMRISAENLSLIGTYFTWEQYIDFFSKNF